MFEIYQTRITPFGGPVVMIVTGYKEAPHTLKGEVFCKFPAPHVESTVKMISLGTTGHEDSPFKLDAEMMLQQAIELGRMEISIHIDRFYVGSMPLVLDGNQDLKKCDQAMLFRLHLRGDDGFLSHVMSLTGEKELGSQLTVATALPKVTWS